MTRAGEPRNRGSLKVFLGYAAGVGKAYQMLTEAHELKRRGVDIVVGYFEPHGRKETIALVEGLEAVPRKVLEYKSSRFEEMDTDAVLQRRPDVAVVDEFPHTNVPGSPRLKRWEDVHVLLDAGVARPDHDERAAPGELERPDLAEHRRPRPRDDPRLGLEAGRRGRDGRSDPRALLNRLARVIYTERAQAALQNFFKESTLVALRELAMRQAAYAIESRLPGEELSAADGTPAAESRTRERLLLLVGPDPSSAALIRRGRRVADYLQADCLAVYVTGAPDFRNLTDEEREGLERHLNFARGLQIETRVLQGSDVAETMVNFARIHGITQIFVAREKPTALRSWFAAASVQRIVNLARDMQVTVVADRSTRHETA